MALCDAFYMEPPDLDKLTDLDVHWRCLQDLITKAGTLEDGLSLQRTRVVTIDRFGSSLAWFGPLTPLVGSAYLTRVCLS